MAIFKKKQKFMTEEDYLRLERRIENLEDNYWELFNMAERYLNECSEQADFRNYTSEKIIDLSNQIMDLEDALKGQKDRLNLLENYYEDVIKEQKARLDGITTAVGDINEIELDIGDLRDKVEKLENWCYVDHSENETCENCDGWESE